MRFIEDASKKIPEIKKAASQRHRTRRALSFPLLRMFLAALTAEKRGLTLELCRAVLMISTIEPIRDRLRSFLSEPHLSCLCESRETRCGAK